MQWTDDNDCPFTLRTQKCCVNIMLVLFYVFGFMFLEGIVAHNEEGNF